MDLTHKLDKFTKEFLELMEKYDVDVSVHELGGVLVITDRNSEEKREFEASVFFDTRFNSEPNENGDEALN